MKFSDNGYYIEKYIKCDNCGVLIYDEGLRDAMLEDQIFCSRWCIEWRTQRAGGIEMPEVQLAFEE